MTEREIERLIEQRDEAQNAADELVNAIELLLGVDCGEHSNLNCPWAEAVSFLHGEIARRNAGAAA